MVESIEFLSYFLVTVKNERFTNLFSLCVTDRDTEMVGERGLRNLRLKTKVKR